MILQLFIFVLLIFGVFHYSQDYNNIRSNKKSHKSFVIYAMVLCALQSGLRNVAVGTDTFAYYQGFKTVYYSSWETIFNSFVLFVTTGAGKDPGYAILEKFFVSIILSYRVYLISIAVLFFCSLGRFLYKYTKSNYEVLVAIALYQCMYYSFFSVTGIRQTIATAFLLFAVPYVFERKLGKYMLLVILAASQHKSALLFLPFYFLVNYKSPRSILLIAFLSYIPMLFLAGTLAKYLTSGTTFEQYAQYLEENEKAGAYSFAMYMIFLSIFVFIKIKTLCSESTSNYVFVSAIAIALALTPLTMIDPNNMRVVQYYSIFGLLIVPKLCTVYSKTKRNKSVYIIIFAFLAVYTLLRNYPYAFCWQEMQLDDVYGASGTISDADLKL